MRGTIAARQDAEKAWARRREDLAMHLARAVIMTAVAAVALSLYYGLPIVLHRMVPPIEAHPPGPAK